MKVKVKITYLWDDTSYIVYSRGGCKDVTDQHVYETLIDSGEKCIVSGKICAERV